MPRVSSMPCLLVGALLLGQAGLVRAQAPAASTKDPAMLRVGDRLPPLTGEFLTGREAQLPDAAAGKVALVMLGFTYGSRHAVEAWGEWFRSGHAGRPGVTFFEVPMIGGMARMGRWFIDSGMRKGTPQALHENVITVYGGTGDWKKRVGYAAEDHAYLLVLDRDGTIRWMHHGDFDEPRARELGEVLDGLVGSS